MNKPDIILTHPTHIDHPYWRYQMREFRDFFNRIIVIFAHSNMGNDYTQAIKSLMNQDQVDFLGPFQPPAGGDWRDNAVNKGLSLSTASRVLFLEQDFLLSYSLLEKVIQDDHDSIFMPDGERLHPAFIIAKRDVINRTSRNFAANPPLYDHFGLFTKELCELGTHATLLNLGCTDWEHLGGLSFNYAVFLEGRPEALHNPARFISYHREILGLDVQHIPQMLNLIKQCAELRIDQ